MRELSITEAEALSGSRLDRRCRYATTDDGSPDPTSGARVFHLARWTTACSGCKPEYSDIDTRGHGCSECGYTGRRRHAYWVPAEKFPREKDD